MVAESREFPGGRSTLVIGFGIDGRLIDRAAGESGGPVDRLLLRDRIGNGYYGGADGLGDSIEATAAALIRQVDDLRPERVVTVGQGIGGHAALVYGCLLGASQIVSIEPYAHLIEKTLHKYHDERWPRELDRLPDPDLAARFEITGLFERERYAGRAQILLGTRPLHARGDAVHLNLIHAHWLARSPLIRLHPFTEYGPGFLTGPDADDRAIQLLSRFLFDEAAEPPEANSMEPVTSARARPGHPIHYHPKLTICRIDERDPTNPSGVELNYASAGEVDVAMTKKMNDGLRRWITENLLLDASPDDLAKTLESRGISRRETLQEIELARFHPYFAGSRRLFNRISKRDWLIASYRKLHRMQRKSTRIERREKPAVSDFLKDYYSSGRPLILTGMMESSATSMSSQLIDMRDRSLDIQSHRPLQAFESIAVVKLLELWPAMAGLFAGEQPILDGEVACLWQGAGGEVAPDLDERVHRMIISLKGKGRMRLIPWWDVLLLDEAERSAREPEEVAVAASYLTPLDRPENFEFTLNPGELLFVPVGCRVRFECLEPATIVNFERFVFDTKTHSS